MRLIDADALVDALSVDPIGCAGCPEPEFMDELIDILDTAPTVEERPTGTWHDSYGFSHCGVCGCGVSRPIGRTTNFKYCPYCGAKNDIEGSDNCE